MRLHNLGTVIGFEMRRTLTKPTFWLTSLSVPLLMVVIFALMWFSNTSAAASFDAQRDEKVAFTYTDASGVVSPAIAEQMGGSPTSDAAGAAQAVHEGRAQLHLDIPADPSTQPVRIVGADLGLIASGQWHAIARDLLQHSAAEKVGDPMVTSLLLDVPTTAELWKDGARSPGFGAAVLPGLFLVLLYMGVIMLGQQMLNITVEEKENRVTEMILTTLDPRVLIVGKVIAVLLVGIVQGLVLLIPAALAALFLPGLMAGGLDAAASDPDLAQLQLAGNFVVDPVRIALAVALFAGGFLLFTALLVAIGSVMPTAKDAGSAFGVVILGMFLPLYTAAMVINEPGGAVALFLTWFPLTAPVTALLLNALGLLPVPQAIGVALVLFACALAFLWAGVRLFRQGSISYDKRLNIAKAFRTSGSRQQI
ncbi:ABC transporter permease [Propioniciclava sp. MC1595]|uniref:ABC transporter permease n=1 Tax=Propioniciclava sp. MC1595 TaxID=2760308 RepID=UPI0016627E19|nr:ABC transporter permease [Propioniciclava sp. MC1595]MBB1496302.1 ABC transporter permease [Propioniciclava sp. MC1595]QTE26050.1 ABC transporter permease [Propioniciclava sp. MC1595]